MANSISDKITQLHLVNWEGAKDILKKHGTFKKPEFWICLIFCFLLSAIVFFIPGKSFLFLQTLSDIVIGVFPNLLGFSLGGYAIIVGFSNTELIKKTSKIDKHSVYQILSAIFALIIITQVLTLLFCFFVSWCIKLDISKLFGVRENIFGNIINAISLFFLSFGAIYSLVMGYYIVINLFTLSQLNNQYYTIEKLKEDKQKVANSQQQSQTTPSNP